MKASLFTPGPRDSQPLALESRRSRERAKSIAAVVFLLGIAIGVLPLPFDDPEGVRRGLTAFLVGLAACVLALRNLERMKKEVEARSAETRGATETAASELREELGLTSAPGPEEAGRAEANPALPLAGVDLRDAVLPGVDLENAELTAAMLDKADLRSTALSGSDLHSAQMRGADLRGADLTGADLRGASLAGASIAGAEFNGAIYDDGTVWPGEAPPPKDLGMLHVEELMRQFGEGSA